MRVPTRREMGSLEFDMTPMIDVTFQLIIFFLVASNLAQQEIQIDLTLPEAASGRQSDEDQTRRVTVNVLADGQIMLGSQPVEPGELSRRIEYEARQGSQELELRIRSDRQVPYRFVEPIMTASAKSGVWKVTFAVTKKE